MLMERRIKCDGVFLLLSRGDLCVPLVEIVDHDASLCMGSLYFATLLRAGGEGSARAFR